MIVSAREELGSALLRVNDVAGATEQFRAITALMPDYARGHLNLANMLVSAQDFDGAERELREALRLQPDNVQALTQLGALLATRARTSEAVAPLTRAVEIDSGHTGARTTLIRVLLAEQRASEAERHARTLVNVAGDAEAHNFLGAALASQGRFEEASQEFAAALRLNPDMVEARNNLARAQMLMRSPRP
jgi:Flp pilus assembly protein TadD